MEISDLPLNLYAEALHLWVEAGLTRPWNDPEADLRRAVEGPASTVLAAVSGGVLTGTVMVGHDGHRGWVYYLAVAAAHRGSDVGRTLMRAAEAWVVQRGIPKIQLMVRTENDAAVGFYERIGYLPADVVVLGRRLDE